MRIPYLKMSALLLAIAAVSAPALAGTPTEAPTRAKSSSQSTTPPPGLRPALYRALSRDAGPAYEVNKEGCAALPKQGLRACFDAHGAHFKGATRPLSLHLLAWGRSGNLTDVTSVRPAIEASRVAYLHGNLTEWWQVLPMGFEQGFTIAKRPSGQGKLTLALAASRQDAGAPGDKAKQGKNVLAWGKLRYGDLVVTDAKGKVIPATLTSEGNRVLIAVNDAHAVYPLTVDPLVWLEQKVVASDGEAGNNFGFSTAVSGNTAIIGAQSATANGHPYQGAAYVFTKANGTWGETQKLTSSDGMSYDSFGVSVALEGDTALIGAQLAGGNGDGPGSVYVFTESNGTWAQTQKLTASDGASFDLFGHNIALSGNTAFIGAQFAPAVYVFSNSDGSWTQTQILTPEPDTPGTFGAAVAFDGVTALIGVPNYPCGEECPAGSALVFTEVNGVWTQTQALTVPKSETDNNFAESVAIEGNTALIGAPEQVSDSSMQTAAYIFTKFGGTWSETQRLTAGDGGPGVGDYFGTSVALDGATALITAEEATVGENLEQGAAYLFTESNGTWTQTQKLAASDGQTDDEFGATFPASLDGTTALIGTYSATVNGNSGQGAAYFYTLSDLALAVSAPDTVEPGENYVSQVLATNNASASSPDVVAVIPVPAAASYLSASVTQGDCSFATETLTCDFGTIAGNAGMATANVMLKTTHIAPGAIKNTAGIAKTTPALTASAATAIVGHNPPVASDGNLTTQENMAVSDTLKATDPDDAPLTFSIVVQPPNGTVKLTDASKGSYTYTPNPDYSGKDSFAFVANDGQSDSNVATVSVTVKAVTPPPPPPPSGGGGGSFGWLSLLALLGLVLIGVHARSQRG